MASLICHTKPQTDKLEKKLKTKTNLLQTYSPANSPWTHIHTHTHTTILRLSGFCLVQPRSASTRRNIHPLTPIVVINHPLSVIQSNRSEQECSQISLAMD